MGPPLAAPHAPIEYARTVSRLYTRQRRTEPTAKFNARNASLVATDRGAAGRRRCVEAPTYRAGGRTHPDRRRYGRGVVGCAPSARSAGPHATEGVRLRAAAATRDVRDRGRRGSGDRGRRNCTRVHTPA